MKIIYLLFVLSFSLMTYCQAQTPQKENGGYRIIDGQQDSISVSPNQPDNNALWEEAKRYRDAITDSTFLRTRGIMSDLAIDPLVPGGWNMNYAYNQVVYLKALERVKRHLSVKDNQFVSPLKSGKEINISEDLHQYICRLLEDWNRWIADGRFKIITDENGAYDITPNRQQ